MNPVELGLPAFAWVMALGVLAGVASIWVFRRCVSVDELRRAVNQVMAHLMEIQLFGEEPRLVLRAQQDLILANGRALRQLLKPSLILLVPYALLLAGMEMCFGHAPLRLGEPALVTAPVKGDLQVPAGIVVDGPPVHVEAENVLVWRVRPVKAVRSGYWAAGDGLAFVMPWRDIEIAYPPATVLYLHWLWWFSLASLIGAAFAMM